MAKKRYSPAGTYRDVAKIEERDIQVIAAWEKGMNNSQLQKAFNLNEEAITKITKKTRLRELINIINRVDSGQIIAKEDLRRLNPYNIRKGLINNLRKKGYKDDYIENCLGKERGWLAKLDRRKKWQNIKK